MKPVIYLDCDGVLADWVGEVNDWLGLPRSRVWSDWDGSGLDWDRINDAMTFVSFWRNMPKLPKAAEIWRLCNDLAPTYICTRPFDDPNCVFGRLTWLNKEMKIPTNRVIFMHDKELLANKQAILIDDNKENVEKFAQNGGHAILFPQSYNTIGELPSPEAKVHQLGTDIANILKLIGYFKND